MKVAQIRLKKIGFDLSLATVVKNIRSKANKLIQVILASSVNAVKLQYKCKMLMILIEQ